MPSVVVVFGLGRRHVATKAADSATVPSGGGSSNISNTFVGDVPLALVIKMRVALCRRSSSDLDKIMSILYDNAIAASVIQIITLLWSHRVILGVGCIDGKWQGGDGTSATRVTSVCKNALTMGGSESIIGVTNGISGPIPVNTSWWSLLLMEYVSATVFSETTSGVCLINGVLPTTHKGHWACQWCHWPRVQGAHPQ